jgi:hypothetical protein
MTHHNHYTTAMFVINLCVHNLSSTRRITPASATENTSMNKKMQSKTADIY